jgi:hypothetical protein
MPGQLKADKNAATAITAQRETPPGGHWRCRLLERRRGIQFAHRSDTVWRAITN